MPSETIRGSRLSCSVPRTARLLVPLAIAALAIVAGCAKPTSDTWAQNSPVIDPDPPSPSAIDTPWHESARAGRAEADHEPTS